MLVHSYSTAVSLLLSHCISEFFKANGESGAIAGRFSLGGILIEAMIYFFFLQALICFLFRRFNAS